MAIPLLTLFVFAPLAGAVLVLLMPPGAVRAMRIAALSAAFASLVVGAAVFAAYPSFPPSPPPSLVPVPPAAKGPAASPASRYGGDLRFVEYGEWVEIPGFISCRYFLGVDGLSSVLLPLASLLTFAAVLAALRIDRRPRGFLALLLLLSTGIHGAFCALDFLLFFVFWEAALVPAFFLIGMWGGEGGGPAARKYLLHALGGSALILFVLAALCFAHGPAGGVSTPTLNLVELARRGAGLSAGSATGGSACPSGHLLFGLLFAGFGVLLPIVPFHTWLSRAVSRAPAPVALILLGAAGAMGLYGLARIAVPLFPRAAAHFAVPMGLLGAVGILHGALCALNQRDGRAFVSALSVSAAGFCVLGLATFTSVGLTGSLLQAFGRGLSASMLLLVVASLGDEAEIGEGGALAGLARRSPSGAILAAVAALAAAGMPGSPSFWAESWVVLGAFRAEAPVSGLDPAAFPILAFAAAFGAAISAAAVFVAFRRILGAAPADAGADLPGPDSGERVSLSLLALAAILFGVWPAPFAALARTAVGFLAAIAGGSPAGTGA